MPKILSNLSYLYTVRKFYWILIVFNRFPKPVWVIFLCLLYISVINVWFIITLLIFLIEPFVTNNFLSINNERRIYKYPVSIGYYEKFQSHFIIIFVALCNIPIVESVVCIVLWIIFLHLTQHSCAMLCVTGYDSVHSRVPI